MPWHLSARARGPLLQSFDDRFIGCPCRIHGLAVSVAPYAELYLEALLLALAVVYQGSLLAMVAARETLRHTVKRRRLRQLPHPEQL